MSGQVQGQQEAQSQADLKFSAGDNSVPGESVVRERGADFGGLRVVPGVVEAGRPLGPAGVD